jgi:hypothetical protein
MFAVAVKYKLSLPKLALEAQDEEEEVKLYLSRHRRSKSIDF